MNTVFISYSSVDRSEALEVRRVLQGRGCTVWLDVFDIRLAAELKHELGSGIAAADVMCLLLSPTAVASRWVAEEIERASAQAKTRGLVLLPVLLRPCRPPDALVGRVMLDATAGLDAPDVRARLLRAVLGKESIGDREIDQALQDALATKQQVLEAAAQLPELAAQLDAVRELPIRSLRISFQHRALPRGKALALSLTFDELFSQPMWFVFAHYREGHTWPAFMPLEELDHAEVRTDGKRVDARLQWFDRVIHLNPELDGTDLRAEPATFNLELSGEKWRPAGSLSSYRGGPSVPHLEQTLELPALASLITKQAHFGLSLLGETPEAESTVELDQNDYDLRVEASFESGPELVLFRSSHGPLERAILSTDYLTQRSSGIEREAILNLYPKLTALSAETHRARRLAAHALLDKADAELSPEERRTVALLLFGEAKLQMFRVFQNAPPPGPIRAQLHREALALCTRLRALLEPIAKVTLDLDDVGMVNWALASLTNYYAAAGVPGQSLPYSDALLALLSELGEKAPLEAEFQRWLAASQRARAKLFGALGQREVAVENFEAALDVLSGLQRELPNAGRTRELAEAIEDALSWARATSVAKPVLKRWSARKAQLGVAPARRGRGGSRLPKPAGGNSIRP